MSEGLLLQIVQVEKISSLYTSYRNDCLRSSDGDNFTYFSYTVPAKFFFLIMISVNIKIFAMFLE